MTRLVDMPMHCSILDCCTRLIRAAGCECEQGDLRIEDLYRALAWVEAQTAVPRPEPAAEDLPTVGKLQEYEAKYQYLRALNGLNQALKMCLEDLVASGCRVPDARMPPEFFVRRILRTGVFFDSLEPSDKEWFNDLREEFNDRRLKVVDCSEEPAVDRARRVRRLLSKPVTLL